MLRRLILLLSALLVTCALGLTVTSVGGPTGAHAAGGYGVGPSQTGATGTARACEATAANHGVSKANGLLCTPPSLAVSISLQCVFTIAGSGLIPGSEVWYFLKQNNAYYLAGTVDSSGNFTASFSPPLGVGSDTLTPAAYTVGSNPNVGATPYFSGSPLTFTCA